MAPLLIDDRGLKKIGFFAVLIMLITFAGGFLLGYQQATVFHTADGESVFLTKDNVIVDSENMEQPAAEITDAGENIDVEQPESAVQATAPTKDLKKMDIEVVEQSIKQDKLAAPAVILPVDEKPAALISVDGSRKIKFSIQVGIYGRLINAQNMREELQEQNLDAYVSESDNKESKFRYNVRFGYFEDKKSALTALKAYKNNQKGDGYVVNFSAENIIADTDNIEQTGAEEIIQDEVSETDITKTPDVLNNTQGMPQIN
jgi:cell division septation protein DedD